MFFKKIKSISLLIILTHLLNHSTLTLCTDHVESPQQENKEAYSFPFDVNQVLINFIYAYFKSKLASVNGLSNLTSNEVILLQHLLGVISHKKKIKKREEEKKKKKKKKKKKEKSVHWYLRQGRRYIEAKR